MMRILKRSVSKLLVMIAVVTVPFLSGCEVLFVQAGKSATAEDTGFLKSYSSLVASRDSRFSSLPDLYFIDPSIDLKKYKNVVVTDLTSLNPDSRKLEGLQVLQFKTLKRDLADQIAGALDGSAFPRVTRTDQRIDPKDTQAISKLSADAVLMANIKELVTLSGLTAAQVEYKLVDANSGVEVLQAIQRSTTDADKVASPQVRAINDLVRKARTQGATTP